MKYLKCSITVVTSIPLFKLTFFAAGGRAHVVTLFEILLNKSDTTPLTPTAPHPTHTHTSFLKLSHPGSATLTS